MRILSLFLFLFQFQLALAETPVSIALNWKPEPQFGGFYTSQIKGLDKKNGIKLDIQAGGSGTPTVQMVAAGRIDFAIVSADEAIIANSKGSDLVALFAVYQDNPQGIMAHKARGFKNILDVFQSEGTLAIQSGLPYAQFILKNLPQKPKAQIVPYSGGIGPFLADSKYSQQCFVTSEPLAARKSGREVQTFLVKEAGFNPYTTVLVTRRKILDERLALVKAVVAMVREGWQTYLREPGSTHEHLAKLNPSMDLATLNESAKAQEELILGEVGEKSLGTMTQKRWQQLTDQLAELKLISKKPDASRIFINL